MVSNNTILRLIFGFKLRYLRLKFKKSYSDLSKETGLSTSYLNDIEKGKKYPKPDKTVLLSKSFGISYDEMVSTQSDKKIQPIVDFISSDFFKLFPAEKFGLNIEKVLDVFAQAPDKTNAFISTVLKMIRSYQIGQEDFYRVALRSYQDIHNNYFQEIENLSKTFIRKNKIGIKRLTSELEKLGYQVNYEGLSSNNLLNKIRAFYDEKNGILYINEHLEEEQVNFQLLKEIGFTKLANDDRPYETLLSHEASFEKLLSNFKASYFAAACLIPEESLEADVKKISFENKWKPDLISQLLKKYKVTPEMLLQRLTNLLPKKFGIDDLFFIRLRKEKDNYYRMTKELHLSRIHNPYNNQLNEHFCKRWLSVTTIQNLKNEIIVDAQISEYIDHNNKYLCITIAQSKSFSEKKPSSVTVGMLITPELRANFNFLKDENIKKKTVHTTCERCPLMDCQERAAEATLIKAKKNEKEISKLLHQLHQNKLVFVQA